ncbi:hypothetical protein [Nostoc favosum]|uniref:Uncharacterized protein n=1 Tax=Nostoc favosum CHAB5714 TaxID=2780399 RepID=A0ABS8ILS8_9NOSO|nr:hypothetical protein [Nostoc favosum]MCC5605088.1 hypothetical protein [Nostoc favosum CHAB5714]
MGKLTRKNSGVRSQNTLLGKQATEFNSLRLLLAQRKAFSTRGNAFGIATLGDATANA